MSSVMGLLWVWFLRSSTQGGIHAIVTGFTMFQKCTGNKFQKPHNEKPQQCAGNHEESKKKTISLDYFNLFNESAANL